MSVGAVEPSPSHSALAYTMDTVGFETYRLLVRRTGRGGQGGQDEEVAPETDGSVAWGADDGTLFYVTMDDAHRPHEAPPPPKPAPPNKRSPTHGAGPPPPGLARLPRRRRPSDAALR